MRSTLLELCGIGKRFPGVVALAEVDFTVWAAGGIYALLGGERLEVPIFSTIEAAILFDGRLNPWWIRIVVDGFAVGIYPVAALFLAQKANRLIKDGRPGGILFSGKIQQNRTCQRWGRSLFSPFPFLQPTTVNRSYDRKAAQFGRPVSRHDIDL